MKPSHLTWMMHLQARIRGGKPLCCPSHLSRRRLITLVSLRLFTKPLKSRNRYASFSTNLEQLNGDRGLLDFNKEAKEDSWSFAVIPGFISPEEEESLMMDVNRSLRGKKYQFDHWDGVSECACVCVCVCKVDSNNHYHCPQNVTLQSVQYRKLYI